MCLSVQACSSARGVQECTGRTTSSIARVCTSYGRARGVCSENVQRSRSGSCACSSARPSGRAPPPPLGGCTLHAGCTHGEERGYKENISREIRVGALAGKQGHRTLCADGPRGRLTRMAQTFAPTVRLGRTGRASRWSTRLEPTSGLYGQLLRHW